MAEWPKLYHPAHYDANHNYVVDAGTVVAGYQLRPDTWHDLATWCDGVQGLVDGNQVVVVASGTAHLGDFVMLRDGVFHVEPADGHYQRWSPA